jgi:hypothetical protein
VASNKEAWAAEKGKLSKKQMTHEEISSLMERRCADRRRQRVTDDDIERWVADEEWAERHWAEMANANIELGHNSSQSERKVQSVALGHVPMERPDGTFRAMMTQLNNISTTRVRNRKAALIQRLVQQYEIQAVGMGEIGINMGMLRRGKRLLSLLPDLGMQTRCSTAHNRWE